MKRRKSKQTQLHQTKLNSTRKKIQIQRTIVVEGEKRIRRMLITDQTKLRKTVCGQNKLSESLSHTYFKQSRFKMPNPLLK